MQPFNLDDAVAALARDGSSRVMAPAPPAPVRIDGFTVGAPVLTSNPPHRGEMHPDGDELLYLISGRVEVLIEEGGTATTSQTSDTRVTPSASSRTCTRVKRRATETFPGAAIAAQSRMRSG